MRKIYLQSSYKDRVNGAPSHADFIKNSYALKKPTDFELVDSIAKADIVIVTEAWRHWDLPFFIRARNTVLRCRRSRPTFIMCDADEPVYLGPGVYVSANRKSIHQDQISGCYISHLMRRFESIDHPHPNDRTNLTFFSGTVRNHKVRRKLVNVPTLSSYIRSDLGDKDASEKRYMHDLMTSIFALCPRGKGTSSLRLFEAMSVGCIPVIISDDWVEPPLISWSDCAVRVKESEVDNILEILESHIDKTSDLSTNCVRTYYQYFSTESISSYIVKSLLTIKNAESHCGVINRFEISSELRQAAKLIYRRSRH